jgi:hypothetical protein
MDIIQPEKPADIEIENLHIWVLGRQIPEAQDYYDGNWLKVIAKYNSGYSVTMAGGPILMTVDIQKFLDGCKKMNEKLEGETSLHSYEINLKVKMIMDKRGKIDGEVSITQDQLAEEHKYKFGSDQSYLQPIITQCEHVLKMYPIRDKDQKILQKNK